VRVLGVALLVASVVGTWCASAQAISVSVTGPEELIYDYSTQHCDLVDPPDGTSTAFRDNLGRTQIVMSQPYNRRLIGPDFDHLTHPCGITMASDASPYPWDFNYAEWIASTWIKPTGEIYALVHTEWHGQSIPGWCPSNVFIKCRYNSVSLAKSTDNGDTFQQVAPAPNHLVAALPYPYWPDSGRYGVFSPSNMLERNGYLYTFLLISQGFKQQAAGACVMRTREQDLDDPHSWRAWDGTGWNVRFINPYLESPEPISRHICEPVDSETIGTMQRSIVYNTALNKYILVGTGAKFDPARGADVNGFFYSTSDDLIHWSERQLLMEVATPRSHICGGPDERVYPSFIDHDSPSPNFDTIDNTTYLYYSITHYNAQCQFGNDRDLARVPLQFSP
jgi:hypothetical protein